MKSWLSWICLLLQIVVLQNRQPVHTFHVDDFEPVSVALHPGETEFAVGSGTVGLPFGILTHWDQVLQCMQLSEPGYHWLR